MRDAGQRRRPCRGTQEGEEDAGGDTRAGRNVAPFTRCGPRPGTSESDRVRRRGLCETIKTRLFRRSLIRSDGVCIQRGDPEAATPQEKPRVDGAETETTQWSARPGPPSVPAAPRSWEGLGRFSPASPREEPALPTETLDITPPEMKEGSVLQFQPRRGQHPGHSYRAVRGRDPEGGSSEGSG